VGICAREDVLEAVKTKATTEAALPLIRVYALSKGLGLKVTEGVIAGRTKIRISNIFYCN